MPSVNDCSRTALTPAPSGVAGMRRNHWLASVGITGWNASESPAGLRRNTHSLNRTTQSRTICDALKFAWLDGRTEEAVTGLTVGMDAYSSVAHAPATWAALRGKLENELFVDFRRLVHT